MTVMLTWISFKLLKDKLIVEDRTTGKIRNMNWPIKLPSGKIVDLNRFVALFPTDETTEGKYELILDGYREPINLEQKDVEFVNQFLQLERNGHSNYEVENERQWDKEEQLRKNQPLMQLIKQWREQKNAQPATAEEIQEYQEIQEALKRNHSTEQKSQV
jgi:hypothetical protein